ncbi:unnamed protein product [Paramecium primaurelia]|uniref:Uncharacterized protein n=1 Tax=Paramecium primaurelia TaxID=5886 RepID=A0A8S1M9E2_PARPR|nr:unnamed protein product [Paramecium primaurelia]
MQQIIYNIFYNIIFIKQPYSLDGEQKFFFVSNKDVASFCCLIRSSFQVDKTITALQGAQGNCNNKNICDLNYFCNNLQVHKDKFYFILTEKRKAETQSRMSSQDDNNNLQFQNNLKFITSPSRSDAHQSVNFPYDYNPTPGLRSSITIMDQLLNLGN